MRKKHIFLLTILLTLFLSIKPAYAWLDCPFGEVNDPAPGLCDRFIDTDGDAICDHSQPAPEDRVEQAEINKQTTDTIQPVSKQAGKKDKYNFILISIAVILAYTASFLLVRMKKLSQLMHKKIWNCLLGLSFLTTAILGLLLVIRLSWGLEVNLISDKLFWHVETGIVFALIAVFHIGWHWPYFKSYFK